MPKNKNVGGAIRFNTDGSNSSTRDLRRYTTTVSVFAARVMPV